MTFMGVHSPRAIYAHTRPPPATMADWETLEEHAAQVATLARCFAAAFGASDWGELLGQWHDLGKRSDDFQNYLRSTADPDAAEGEETSGSGRVDHSTFGTATLQRPSAGTSDNFPVPATQCARTAQAAIW